MRCAKVIIKSRLVLMGSAVLMLAAPTTVTKAQRAPNPARDAIRTMQIKDMDRMLQYKLLPPTKEDNAARVMVMRQIGEDFKELQLLNNKMMSEAWAKEDLNYGFLSEMMSRIRGKASRLKENMALPQPAHLEKAHPVQSISNASDFRSALMLLDRTIMSFISNPLFKQANTIELQAGVNARRDLENVIDLTNELKKTAARLGKELHTP